MGKIKQFIEDFKAFAMKGNVIDMAVGVVVGGAFSKIVSSLVADIITPLISLLTGGVNMSELYAPLRYPAEWVEGVALPATVAAAKDAGFTILSYGAFIQTIIDFLIIALSIFVVLRIAMNAQKNFEKLKNLAKKKEEAAAEEAAAEEAAAEEAPAEPDATVALLAEIRDLLKKD